jgi:hypothetical protein
MDLAVKYSLYSYSNFHILNLAKIANPQILFKNKKTATEDAVFNHTFKHIRVNPDLS